VQTGKISPNFEVEIPVELREKLDLKPGEQLEIWELGGVIRISRPSSIKELRGMVKGMRWDDYRDRRDRY